MPAKKPRRLGRPPASSSAETRERILEVARLSFAEMGFDVTTNKYLATKAGITTGALYHYFDSKLEIYRAVYEHVQTCVYDAFNADLEGVDTFIGRFETVLETAHRLNIEDPSLARFIGAVRIDLERHDDLREALTPDGWRGSEFFQALIDHGVATGEIRPQDREMVYAFVRITVTGLTDAVSDDHRTHRVAVDAIRALLEGRLMRPVAGGRPVVKRVSAAKPARRRS